MSLSGGNLVSVHGKTMLEITVVFPLGDKAPSLDLSQVESIPA